MDNNRLYCEDCLPVLMRLKEEGIKVDLIYLDPPFNSNRSYNVIFRNVKGDPVQQIAFADTFDNRNVRQLALDIDAILNDGRINQVTRTFLQAWLEPLKQQNRPSDRRLLSYLIYMTQRLLAMKDVLSDTGSIFYHCDPTASHYIKIIMDGIFGRDNFRNEIIWCYTRMSSKNQRQLSRAHDVIFRYSKGSKWYFDVDPIRVPYAEGSKKREGMTLNKLGSGYSKEGVTVLNPIGKFPEDWIVDVPYLRGKERKGYDTQKPIKLLNKIIQSSCPPNGIVLDPFCGCGTTIDSAVDNQRQWIGIDISYYATDIIKATLLERRGVKEGEHYKLNYGNPETIEKYRRMNALEKQDFAIRAVGGIPNDKHTGDGGIDGEMTIHLGYDEDGKDKWGKMVFSVKTGKQRTPSLVRELIGTMKANNYDMAGLIVDADPTEEMLSTARKLGAIKYVHSENSPPDFHDRVQILTTDQIINHDERFDTPYTMRDIMRYREKSAAQLRSGM